MQFTISGQPIAKGRPKFTKRGFAYTPDKTREYEEWVKWEFTNQIKEQPYENPVEMNIKFYIEIPKSYPKQKQKKLEEETTYRGKKPDLDNLIKAVTDSINGLAYVDDSLIVKIKAEKFYGKTPRTEVEIKQVE